MIAYKDSGAGYHLILTDREMKDLKEMLNFMSVQDNLEPFAEYLYDTIREAVE